MARILTPEEIEALRAGASYVPAPRETFHILVDAGEAELTPEEIAALKPGDVIPLHRAAGERVEILANGMVIARGTLVEHDGRAAVRVDSLTQHPSQPPRKPR